MSSSQAIIVYESQKKKTDILERVTESTKEKQSNSENILDYVKNTKRMIKLEMLNLQNQLETLEIFEQMPNDAKMEFLFTNLDKDNNGHVDAIELSDGLRKVNANIGFQEALDQAIHGIAKNDIDGDATLDYDEFKTYMNKFTESAGVAFQDVADFMLMQVIFSQGGNSDREKKMLKLKNNDVKKKVKKEKEYYDAYDDIAMRELFEHFDVNKDGLLDFKEVARGLWKIKRGGVTKATRHAMDLILMTDKDDDRKINYDEFVHLILHFCATEWSSFNDVASAFVVSMYFENEMTPEEQAELKSEEEFYYSYRDEIDLFEESSGIMDALKYVKMQKLFDLCDTNNDGSISREELTLMLRKVQRSMNINVHDTVMISYFAMQEFDRDGNKTLDKHEFARFLFQFAKKSKVDLHKLIDRLAIVALLEENGEEEEKYIKSLVSNQIEYQNNNQIKVQKSVTTNKSQK